MEELRKALTGEAPTKKKRFSRGQVYILSALAIAALGIYGLLMVSFVRGNRAPTPITAGSAGGGRVELGVAHKRAQRWAVKWQPDAQLVGAATRWQLTGGDRLTIYRPSWSFSFYSPAAGQVQILTVDEAGVQPIRQVPVGKAPAPVEADWSIDSDDLLYTFMAYGGEKFLGEHAHVNLHFRLSGQDAGRPIWYLSAIDPETRQSFVVGVDALSRQVVQTS
jgi:hypothetical protein